MLLPSKINCFFYALTEVQQLAIDLQSIPFEPS